MLTDYLAIVGSIGLWTAVVAGWGALSARGFTGTSLDFASRLWLGVSTLVFLLQVAQLLVPISTGFALVVIVVGLGSLVRFGGWRAPEVGSPRALALAAIAALAWIGLRALGPVLHYDSGMYHLPLLEWYQRFPIVPGLANLHGRFGFNNSIFLLTATLDRFPIPGQGHHLINGVLAMTAGLGFLSRALSGAAERSLVPSSRACVVFAVGLIGLLLTARHVTSPSPVFAAALLPWFGAAELLTYRRDTRLGRAALVRSMIHFAVAATVKLSNAAIGAVGGFVLLTAELLLGRSDRFMRGVARRTVGVAAGIMGVWCLRGAILSGYLAYPIPATALPLPWRTPIGQAEAEQAWIKQYSHYWQRSDFNLLPDYHGASGAGWAVDWIGAVLTRSEVSWMLVVPIAVSLIAVARLRRGSGAGYRGRLIPLVSISAALAGLAVWIASAPRPDFGLGPLWMLAATLYASETDEPRDRIKGSRSIFSRIGLGTVSVGLVLILSARPERLALRQLAARALGIPHRDDAGLRPLPAPRLVTDTLPSGLVVTVPVADNRCWRSPPPCTPHPEPGLRLRVPGDLSRGFENPGPWLAVDFPNKQNRVWLPSWLAWDRQRRPQP